MLALRQKSASTASDLSLEAAVRGKLPDLATQTWNKEPTIIIYSTISDFAGYGM